PGASEAARSDEPLQRVQLVQRRKPVQRAVRSEHRQRGVDPEHRQRGLNPQHRERRLDPEHWQRRLDPVARFRRQSAPLYLESAGPTLSRRAGGSLARKSAWFGTRRPRVQISPARPSRFETLKTVDFDLVSTVWEGVERGIGT